MITNCVLMIDNIQKNAWPSRTLLIFDPNVFELRSWFEVVHRPSRVHVPGYVILQRCLYDSDATST